MQFDWYTKGVLTVIAVLLGVIALRPCVSPDAVADAQGSFAGVQFSNAPGTYFLDGAQAIFGNTRPAPLWHTGVS